VVDPGEQCDDGNDDTADACAECSLAYCGDGFTQAGVEECDDGNDVDTDDCLPVFCKTATCGDGFLWAGNETCDDGNLEDTDACPTTCEPGYCGDGFEWEGMEECDDGNDQAGDGCKPDCSSEFPPKCTEGVDPWTNAPWVVCASNQDSAWISADNQGQFHPVAICQDLGYDTVGAYGGTCGNVCGYCEGQTSCQNNGSQNFDHGNWNGNGNCGQDGNGPIICQTVMWSCVNN
jgi:cysteine-rich repeat protein